jgi:uncharacterized protein
MARRLALATMAFPMPLIHHETSVAAPLAQIWLFFTDPVKNLPRISPPSDAVVIESADLPIKEGSKVVVAGKDPFGRRVRWESRIQQLTPPHAVVFGMEARFVDVQLSGPFRAWQHAHEFEAIDSKNTRVIDRITYQPPAGLLGVLADWLLIRWRLRSTLKYRARMLREIFPSQ